MASAYYAFENTWHVIALIGGLVTVRAVAAHVRALRSHRAAIIELADSFLIAVLLVFCILRPFVIQAFYIPSGSMEPTLQVGDRLLVNKFIYYFEKPEHGDIVVFDAPPYASREDKDFIKRVVGVPGDRIRVDNGKLYRNGQPIDESYLAEPPYYIWPPGAEQGREVTVPHGHLLVFGDNRNDSNDSHRWQAMTPDGDVRMTPFVPIVNVRGRAMLIFWPPKRIRLLR